MQRKPSPPKPKNALGYAAPSKPDGDDPHGQAVIVRILDSLSPLKNLEIEAAPYSKHFRKEALFMLSDDLIRLQTAIERFPTSDPWEISLLKAAYDDLDDEGDEDLDDDNLDDEDEDTDPPDDDDEFDDDDEDDEE